MWPSATSNNIHRCRCKHVLKVAPSKLAVNESAYYNKCKKRKDTPRVTILTMLVTLKVWGSGAYCMSNLCLAFWNWDRQTDRQTDRKERYNSSGSKKIHLHVETHTHTPHTHPPTHTHTHQRSAHSQQVLQLIIVQFPFSIHGKLTIHCPEPVSLLSLAFLSKVSIFSSGPKSNLHRRYRK